MNLSDKFLQSGIEALKNLADYAGKSEVEKARLVRILEGKTDLIHAFEMGRDYAKNGTTALNCDFSLFTTKGSMEAWERGKADADNL